MNKGPVMTKNLPEGWYEFHPQPANTTEIAHVGEGAIVYIPDTRVTVQDWFSAVETGNIHRLVREEPLYADTDSMHAPGTGPFLLSELFGEHPHQRLEDRGAPCLECGALVSDLMTHTEWHNKVADL